MNNIIEKAEACAIGFYCGSEYMVYLEKDTLPSGSYILTHDEFQSNFPKKYSTIFIDYNLLPKEQKEVFFNKIIERIKKNI